MPAKILLAEDEPDIVATIKMMLEIHGYRITTAYDGDEALAIAKEDKFDLFLLDVLMPKTLGDDLGSLLKKDPRNAHTPIVFLTNLPLEALTGLQHAHGVPFQRDAKGNYYLQKYCSDEDLLTTLELALRG